MQQSSNRARPTADSGDDTAVETGAGHNDAAYIEAWARHAAAANGFGDAAVAHPAPRDQATARGENTCPEREPGRPGKTQRR